MGKREHWQSIHGICILAVVLFHSLGGFDYSVGYGTEFIILRQVINSVVATFVFMSGYFVPVENICNKDFSYKEWILNRRQTVRTLCNLVFVLQWNIFGKRYLPWEEYTLA